MTMGNKINEKKFIDIETQCCTHCPRIRVCRE